MISPLLANVYLHYVLDLWVQAWRENSAYGWVILVRYADDFVLELHPAKTRLIELGRWALAKRARPRGRQA